MRNFTTVVNDSTAISTQVIGGVTYVNIKGSEYQLKKGSVVFPAAATATAAGTAGTAIVTFGGTYLAGDKIRVSFSLPKSEQHSVKSFSYTVPAGGVATTAIAAAVANIISAAITNGSLEGVATAIAAGSAVTFTQTSVFKELLGDAVNSGVVVSYTDSVAGTAVITDSATVIEYGTPAALINEGVDASAIGLASYSTLLLVNKVDAAIPFIDAEGKIVQEVKYFSTPAITAALIAAL